MICRCKIEYCFYKSSITARITITIITKPCMDYGKVGSRAKTLFKGSRMRVRIGRYDCIYRAKVIGSVGIRPFSPNTRVIEHMCSRNTTLISKTTPMTIILVPAISLAHKLLDLLLSQRISILIQN